MKYNESYFDNLFLAFKETLTSLNGYTLPSVSQIAIKYDSNPFLVLISTILSLRTKDSVTLSASFRLFDKAKNPEEILALSNEELEKLIYPVSFYKRKTETIKKISAILISQYNGLVPSNAKELMQLPGVGIKSANLTLNLGFNIEAICVDCHVHTICNRLGIINTNTPEESEKALQMVMPKRFWIPLNELFVSYGMQVCTPISPKCSICPMCKGCTKRGVTQSR